MYVTREKHKLGPDKSAWSWLGNEKHSGRGCHFVYPPLYSADIVTLHEFLPSFLSKKVLSLVVLGRTERI